MCNSTRCLRGSECRPLLKTLLGRANVFTVNDMWRVFVLPSLRYVYTRLLCVGELFFQLTVNTLRSSRLRQDPRQGAGFKNDVCNAMHSPVLEMFTCRWKKKTHCSKDVKLKREIFFFFPHLNCDRKKEIDINLFSHFSSCYVR